MNERLLKITTLMTLVLLAAVMILTIPATAHAETDESTYCKENLTIDELIASGNYNVMDYRDWVGNGSVWKYGTDQDDLMIAGELESDSTFHMFAREGNDCLIGGDGKDYLHGGSGDDYLYGNDGSNRVLAGGGGNDVIHAGYYAVLYAGEFNGSETGVDGDDILYGNVDGNGGYIRVSGGSDTVYANHNKVEIHDDGEHTIHAINTDRSKPNTYIIYKLPIKSTIYAAEWDIFKITAKFFETGDDGRSMLDSYTSDKAKDDQNDSVDPPESVTDPEVITDPEPITEDPPTVEERILPDEPTYCKENLTIDELIASGNYNVIQGPDSYSGTDADDLIIILRDTSTTANGKDGNDCIIGGPANDRIIGGYGDDYLHGNGGDDSLYGREGDDHIFGGSGDDTINGGTGNDTIDGGEGNNTIKEPQEPVPTRETVTITTPEPKTESRTVASPVVTTEPTYCAENLTIQELIASDIYNIIDERTSGKTKITGTNTNDLILVHDMGASVKAKQGNDCIIGGAGQDTLRGNNGDDYIHGDTNDTMIAGGKGNDACTDVMPDVRSCEILLD